MTDGKNTRAAGKGKNLPDPLPDGEQGDETVLLLPLATSEGGTKTKDYRCRSTMNLRAEEICKATQGRLLTTPTDTAVRNVCIDSRSAAEGSLFIPLKGTQHDGHIFIEDAFINGATGTLVENETVAAQQLQKGFPDRIIVAVDCPLTALGDLAAYWRRKFSLSVVAVTGSNGKTTTKEMLWNIVSRSRTTMKNPGNYNNLIGLPLSLFALDGSSEVAVVEMGMNAPGEIKRLAEISKPGFGLITNVGPAHLEGLETIEAVAAAKKELFDALCSDDTAIINNDDKHLASFAPNLSCRTITFGINKAEVRATSLRNDDCFSTTFDLVINEQSRTITINLMGNHAVSNALAAAAAAHGLGVPIEEIRTGLETFEGVPGRMEVLDIHGITVINDSYNANPVSMQASLNVLASMKHSRRRIAALGDMLELGKASAAYHRQLGEAAARLRLDRLFVVGEFSLYVQEGACKTGMSDSAVCVCDDVSAVEQKLSRELQEGDALLIKASRKMRMERLIDVLRQKNEQ